MNSNASTLEDILVIGTLVYVLEPSPTAHVIDEKGSEVGSFGLDISHELIEPLATGDIQPTTAMVGVLLDDLHVVGRCILADDLELVFRRILLVLGRHAYVLSRTRWGRHRHGC